MSSRADLEALLAERGLVTETIEHPPVHTVEEALPYWAKLDATHTKNLFLKGQKGDLWLLCAAADRRIDLKGVAKDVGAKRFSFANDDLLFEALGVRQGAVSPFALINDREGKVRLILDADLLKTKRLAFHPLENTATVALDAGDLLPLLQALDHEPVILTLLEPVE